MKKKKSYKLVSWSKKCPRWIQYQMGSRFWRALARRKYSLTMNLISNTS